LSGQLHEGVAELLAAGAGVPGRPVGLQDRLQCSLDLLPTDGVKFEPAGDAPVGVLRDAERAAFGGVGFGAVRVEQFEVVVHHLRQLGVWPGRCGLGQHGVDLLEVDALRGGRRAVFVAGDRCDDGDLVRGQPACGERGGHRGQVGQRPPGAHELTGRRRGQAGVAAQPGLHGLQPVVLGRLGELALAD
jgi:hypothetical protein